MVLSFVDSFCQVHSVNSEVLRVEAKDKDSSNEFNRVSFSLLVRCFQCYFG